MPRDATLICKSIHHGNTWAVAERIAACLDAQVIDPETVSTAPDFSSKLIGLGSGIYYGRFHREIRRWIAELPLAAGQGRAAFVFSTSGLPFLSWLYHWPLKRALARRGFQVLGDFSCRGHDTFGPLCLIGGLNRKHPNAKDLDRAEAFAMQLKRHVDRDNRQRAEPLQSSGSVQPLPFVASIDSKG